MTKRHTQASCCSGPVRMDGDKRITRCNDHDRFIGGLCQETGRKIKYPISGPIPDDCPLPKAKDAEEEKA